MYEVHLQNAFQTKQVDGKSTALLNSNQSVCRASEKLTSSYTFSHNRVHVQAEFTELDETFALQLTQKAKLQPFSVASVDQIFPNPHCLCDRDLFLVIVVVALLARADKQIGHRCETSEPKWVPKMQLERRFARQQCRF